MSIDGFVKSLKARREVIQSELRADPDRQTKSALNRELRAIDDKLALATREKITG